MLKIILLLSTLSMGFGFITAGADCCGGGQQNTTQ